MCLLFALVLPVYGLKTYTDYTSQPEFSRLILYLLLCLQTLSTCCLEMHFFILCYIIYQKIQLINDDLSMLKVDTIIRNNYPFLSHSGDRYITTNFNYSGFKLNGMSKACFVRYLRIKYYIIGKAVKNLNNVFGIQLGIFLCTLWLMALFDLYYDLTRGNHPDSDNIFISKLILYGWILQYTTRFILITLIAHITTKEAYKTKVLITDINNRFLDPGTKEELQLFFNQISSNSMEFTACDFFTLNTHLITSAIAAGTTYLVILLQFNSSNKQ
ncbi:gustatory receptor for sugar taste 43a-like [Adelges cooleyi]|uniref:gustatory receptor for sugar taste 43a-like n=1 Tax=Adelges cooleyi TaxID=133065 RepID=UPI0021801462|nr:gustatory receptor for sugar taste 43a-like [Adelges cooleyi]